MLVASLVAALMGCGPHSVTRGPESCEQAKSTSDEFGRSSRGNWFHYDNDYRAVGLFKTDKGLFLNVVWTAVGEVDERIAKGAEVVVALEGGRTLDLEVFATATPVSDANRAAIFTQWTTESQLTTNQLKMLADMPIVALRTAIAGQEFVQKTYPDPAARLQSVAICLAGGY